MDKRILSIWDFRTVPYSLGDLVTLLERLQIEKTIYEVDSFDIAFVYDPKVPARYIGYQGITEKNYHYHFTTLMQIAMSNKNVNAFYIFDDYEKLYKFAEGYDIISPSLDRIKNKDYTYRENFNYIQDFYRDNKYIPKFELRQGTLENVYNFYLEHLKYYDFYPVVCHIRNSQSESQRNSNREAWINFFIDEKKYKDIIFVVIGTKNETDYFRGMENVIISKDYFSSAEYDMALIATSYFFLGTRSGTMMMAYFTGTPCVIFDYDKAPHENIEQGSNFNFANPCQKLVWERATTELISQEFERLYHDISKSKWLINAKIFEIDKYNKSDIEL